MAASTSTTPRDVTSQQPTPAQHLVRRCSQHVRGAELLRTYSCIPTETSGRQTSSTRRRRMPNRPGVAAAAGEGGRSLSITSTRTADNPGTARPSSWASQAGIEEVEPRAGDQALPLVCRPGLELHTGVAGLCRERHGNLGSDGGQAVLSRALARRAVDRCGLVRAGPAARRWRAGGPVWRPSRAGAALDRGVGSLAVAGPGPSSRARRAVASSRRRRRLTGCALAVVSGDLC